MVVRALLTIAVLLVGALLASGPTPAQDDTGACPALVQRALDELGSNCTVLDRNSACYGFNRVDATFTQVMASGFFSEPADRAGLENFARIATVPLDTERDHWGIALMNVQANVPGSLPGQAVVFLLMGDTEVENAVDPADMYIPAEPIVVKVIADTGLHSGPAAATNLVDRAAAGQMLQADALNSDETWLRVVTDFGPAWVSRDTLDPLFNPARLPVVTEESRTPMQAFFFRTAFTDLECVQAPSLLALQSPRGIEVDLTVNGANIRMGSRAVLRTLPPGNVLEIITVSGTVTLEPGTPNERVVPAGTKVRALLNDDGTVILTSFSLPEPISPDDEALLETVGAAFTQLGLPDEEATADEPALPVSIITTGVCVPGQQVVHTVAPSETLFQLALIYNTSVAAIRQANNLPGTQVFAGQQLVITCGGAVIPTASPPPPVDCGPFRATSPLDGLPNGIGTFYWDAAPGADDYRVIVTGESGTQVFTAGGSQTNLSANLSVASIGYGFSFTWYVEALRGGAVVCSTPPVTLFREASPPDNPPPPTDRPANPPPTEEPTPLPTQEPTPPPETEEPTLPATEEIIQPPSTEEPLPPPAAIGRLTLSPLCSPAPAEIRVWQVRNPNLAFVPVRWAVNQTNQSGGYLAPPGDSSFTTNTVLGANLTFIFWIDENGVEQQDSSTSNAAPCEPAGRT